MSPAARRASSAPKPAAASLVATGPPRRLSFDLPPVAVAEAASHPIAATLNGATISKITLSARGIDRGRAPRIKVRVDPLTPPGRYEGTATIGKTTIPLVADVLASTNVRTTPTMIEVSPAPGESVTVTVTLQNLGNVPTDVPATTTFPLLDRSGIGDAFYHAIGEPPPEGKQRIDVLLDDLAESSGGVVTATAVKDVDGPIAPGKTGTIQLTLTFSERLRPGAQYAGGWNIDATHVPVRVTVPGGEPAVPAPEGEPPVLAPSITPTAPPKPNASPRKKSS